MSYPKTGEQLRLWEIEQKLLMLGNLKSVCIQLENLGGSDHDKYETLLRLQFPSTLGTYQEITDDGIKGAILRQIKSQLRTARKLNYTPVAVLEEMATKNDWHCFSWSSHGYDKHLAQHAAATASSTEAMNQYSPQYAQYSPYQ